MTLLAAVAWLFMLACGSVPGAKPQLGSGAESEAESGTGSVARPEDPLAVSRFVLDNGLTVFVSENHASPDVFGAVVVKTGARNDPADNTGMAHYLEHMLFKGTTTLGTTDWARERPLQERIEALYDELAQAKPADQAALRSQIAAAAREAQAFAIPNEMDQLLRQFGGTSVNAFTSYDETVYHNTLPASQLGVWLEIYAHRFSNPVFRLFPTELEAVYEEKNIALDTTGYALFTRFMAAAFEGHPYGRNDILGEIDHLKRPSLRAMRTYFDKYYVPSNMALVVSGDVDAQAVLSMVEATFGAWKSAPKPVPEAYTVKPFAQNQRLTMRATPVRLGGVAYHTVPEAHPEFAALRVARRLLSNEQRTGFIDRLAEDGKVLLAVHVPADFAEVNLDAVAYLPRLVTQTFGGAERAVLSQFDRIAEGDFEEASFLALKEGLLAEEAKKWEDNRERGLAIAHAFVARGGWEGYLDYLQRLRALQKADVVRMGQRVFGDRRLIVRSRVGFPKKARLAKPALEAVAPVREQHSAFFTKLQKEPPVPPHVKLVDERRRVQHIRIRPGVVLKATANPFNDLYQLDVVFGLGHEAVPSLALLAQYLPKVGTTELRGTEFREHLFALSTSLSAESTPDAFIVTLQGPSAHMAEALMLLDQLMARAEVDRRTLRKLRWEIWGWRRVAREDGSTVATALMNHVMYGDNSRFHQEFGPGSAREVSARDLVEVWSRAQNSHVTLRYAGPQGADVVAATVRERVSFRSTLGAPVDPVVYPRQLPDEPTVYFLPKRGAVQSRMWFAVNAGELAPKERAAADAFAEYFGGGTAGLVFAEVREYRALAYAAYGTVARDASPTQDAAVMAFVGCQTDKTLDTIGVVLELFEHPPLQQSRIDYIRQALLHMQETDEPSFRELHETLEEWRRKGYHEDPRGALEAEYRALDFDDVTRFHAQHVAPKPVSIFIVGDPRKLRVRDLRRFGTVIRLQEREVFSP